MQLGIPGSLAGRCPNCIWVRCSSCLVPKERNGFSSLCNIGHPAHDIYLQGNKCKIIYVVFGVLDKAVQMAALSSGHCHKETSAVLTHETDFQGSYKCTYEKGIIRVLMNTKYTGKYGSRGIMISANDKDAIIAFSAFRTSQNLEKFRVAFRQVFWVSVQDLCHSVGQKKTKARYSFLPFITRKLRNRYGAFVQRALHSSSQ